jgi:hypothetical protein
MAWFRGGYEDADSESEDYDDPEYFRDLDCFFDEDELKRIQLDEITIMRKYTRLTCL